MAPSSFRRASLLSLLAHAMTSAPRRPRELHAARADAARGAEDQPLSPALTWPIVWIMRTAVPYATGRQAAAP